MSKPPIKLQKSQTMRVALVCDWLTTPGGAEKVLLELHQMYPSAPIYTSQYSCKGIAWFDDADVRTGWLQIFPKGLRKFLGPLRQLYFSHLDLSDYDLVISVTGAEAKSVKTTRRKAKRLASSRKQKHPILPLYHTDGKKSRAYAKNQQKLVKIAGKTAQNGPQTAYLEARPEAYHLCYCHVPTQYYWQLYDQYLENPGFGILNPLVKLAFRLLVKPLRQADYAAAQRPDQFITISSYAQAQIRKYYGRESAIVAPPVAVKAFAAGKKNLKSAEISTEIAQKSTDSGKFSTKAAKLSTEISTKKANFSTKNNELSTSNQELFHRFSTSYPQFYIIACRQANWKRVDLAIAACLRLKRPLLVVGDGPEHDKLVQQAGLAPYIRFIPWVEPTELAQYLAQARAYLFPSLEPFGIAAVEALAAGCPVIALEEGGSRDFVTPGQNGVFFAKQTTTSLTKAIQEFEKLHFDRGVVAQSAAKFDTSQFRKGIRRLALKPREVRVIKEEQSAQGGK